MLAPLSHWLNNIPKTWGRAEKNESHCLSPAAPKSDPCPEMVGASFQLMKQPVNLYAEVTRKIEKQNKTVLNYCLRISLGSWSWNYKGILAFQLN